MREFLLAKEARKAAASSTLSVSAVEFTPIRAAVPPQAQQPSVVNESFAQVEGGAKRRPVTQPSPNMAATSYANVLRGDSTTTDGVLRHGGAVTKDRRLAVPAPPLLPPAVTQNRLGHGPRYIPPPAPASPSAPDPSARKAGSA
jgi:hypothetical protein